MWWDGYLVGTWVPSTVMVSLAHTSPPPPFPAKPMHCLPSPVHPLQQATPASRMLFPGREGAPRSPPDTDATGVASPTATAADHPPAPLAAALLIGINDYDAAPPQIRCKDDARELTEVLRRVGVPCTCLMNATKRRLEAAVASFGDDVGRASAGCPAPLEALLYFSGHVLYCNGQLLLAPVDVAAVGSAGVG